ncbi:MAG TPA: hypothetical protein VFZ52_12645 [Chryseolinea sp.]
MKTLSILLIMNFCMLKGTVAQVEPKTEDQNFFENAVDDFENEYYIGAAEKFEAFLTKFPKSPLVPRAHFNLGLTHSELRNYITAKRIFHQILDQPYNEQDENNVMEPYALYKHNSCRQLAAIALVEKDYMAAAKYIRMFDEEYPYQHFCGNEWSAYYMYKATMLAKVYKGRGELKKALTVLLPFIFSDELASNEEVLRELSHLLDEHYTKDQIREDFTRALTTLEVREKKKQRNATMKLYGVKVILEDYYNDPTIDAREYFQQKIREHELFRKFL